MIHDRGRALSPNFFRKLTRPSFHYVEYCTPIVAIAELLFGKSVLLRLYMYMYMYGLKFRTSLT